MSYQDLPTDDQVAAVDELWGIDGIEVLELFSNTVPRVRTDKVVKPTGMPPAEWSIAA